MTVQGDANDEEKRTEGVHEASAHDVKAIFRRQNKIVFGGIMVLVILGLIGVRASITASSASKDSFNATSVQLATQSRNACITARRNLQAEAMGRETIAAHRAQVAGLLERDEAEAARQAAIVARNAALWEKATTSLSEEVLNQDPPLGCGPPILTIDDLKEVQE